MKTAIPNPFPDGQCFYCGDHNPHGLKMKFYWDDEALEVSTQYDPPRYLVGQGNILHGGIQIGFLDEIMGWTSRHHTGENVVTTNLNTTFMKPVYLGQTVNLSCKVSSVDLPKVYLRATLSDAQGNLCTAAEGTYHVLPPGRFEAIIQGE